MHELTNWDVILKAGAVLTLVTTTFSKILSYFRDGRNARRYKQERDDLRDQVEGMIEDRKRAKEWEESLKESVVSSTPKKRRRPSTKTFFEEQFVSEKSADETTSAPETS